jgi:hypothetical protein
MPSRRFVLYEAAPNPATGGPWLVTNPHHVGRYAGVAPKPQPVKDPDHVAEQYAPAREALVDHPYLHAAVAAGHGVIHAHVIAKNHDDARVKFAALDAEGGQ